MGILWDIYESELFRPQKIQTDEYKQALDRVCKAEDALLNTYPECKDLLLKYQEAESNLVHMDTRQMFVTGVRLGGKFMLEVTEKTEDKLNRQQTVLKYGLLPL